MAYVPLVFNQAGAGNQTLLLPNEADSIILIRGLAGTTVPLSAKIFVGNATTGAFIAQLQAQVGQTDNIMFPISGVAATNEITVEFLDTDENHIVFVYVD